MEEGKEAILFFFGLFWAAALSAAARYRAFDTTAPFRSPIDVKAVRRLFVGVLVLNVLPVVYLMFLLSGWVGLSFKTADMRTVASAATASLGVFSFHRIFHAICATRRFHGAFYDDASLREVLKSSGHSEHDGMLVHLAGAFAYLAGAILIAVGIQSCWRVV